MFYFQSFFVTRETNNEKKKSDPSGTRTQDLSLSTPSTLPTELHRDTSIRHFSLLNVNAAGACGYDFPCDGGRLVRAYLRQRRGTI